MADPSHYLKSTIIDMITDIRENVLHYEEEQADLNIIELFFKANHEERIMHRAIKYILPHRDAIKDRDAGFFKNNKFLFSGLDEEKVDYYMKVISDPRRFTPEDEDTLFQYFDTIITILEVYKNK